MIQKSILFVAAVLLLSACSSNFSLMKRRYTKGYYVTSSKHTATPKHATEIRKNPAAGGQPEVVIVTSSAPTTDVAAPAKANQNYAAPASSSTKRSASPSQAAKKAAPVKETKHLQAAKQEAAKDIQSKKVADSGAKLIIMVILCFFWFLNLIAIYMHDGDITLNFWITLLLDFTFIGGIIFSLLVVLDIVDLR